MDSELSELVFQRTELFNQRQTYDPKNEKEQIRQAGAKLKEMDARIRKMQDQKKERIAERKREAAADHACQRKPGSGFRHCRPSTGRRLPGRSRGAAGAERRCWPREIELSVGRYSPVKRQQGMPGSCCAR